MNLSGKNAVIGITGGIAAYKACEVVSRLRKSGVNVDVIMTKHACEFVQPLTFETLSNQPVTTDMFHRERSWEVGHVALAQKADFILIAPATANLLAKAAAGIADDMLSTTLLAARCPVLYAPAMNTAMWLHPATQTNCDILRSRGAFFVGPASGFLACGDQGPGRMAEPDEIIRACEKLFYTQDFQSVRVVVTAGPTRETIDPVRYISNRSSGKMGYAIAEEAYRRGAQVTLIAGPGSLPSPEGFRTVKVISTKDLFDTAVQLSADADIFIQAAAPCDFTPAKPAEQKIKKDGSGMQLELIPTPDIAKECGRHKRKTQVFVGFAAETENLVENAQKKIASKNLDFVVLNDVSRKDAGFEVDTNQITILTENQIHEYPLMTKANNADVILDTALKIYRQKNDTQ